MLKPLLSMIALVLSVSVAQADAGLWQGNSDLAKVRLISATDSVPQEGPLRLGLEFEINSGWVTYWKIQGPVGVPLQADWSESLNVSSAVIHYPLPERYTYSLPGYEDESMESFVYRERLVLPVDIEVEDPNQPVLATANLQFTVCGELCVFTDANVRLDVFPGNDSPAIEAEIIEQFQSQVPPMADSADNPLALVGHRFDAKNNVLEYQLESTDPMQSPDVFVASDVSGFVFGKPTINISGDATQALVRIPIANGGFGGEDASNTDLYVTIANAGQGVDLGYIRTGDEASFMPRLQGGEFTVTANQGGLFGFVQGLLGQ